MKRLLLYSYYYPPFDQVGALRAAAFARYLPEFGWRARIVTATPQEGRSGDVEHVPCPPASRLRRLLVKDPGARWLAALKQHAADSGALARSDAVLITGGPFLQFEMAVWVKKRYPHLPVVLDFRDPFAHNPRMKRRPVRDFLARRLESRWLRRADAALVVTEHMKALLHSARPQTHVIRNGYDDEAVRAARQAAAGEPARSDAALTIAYTGKIYSEHNPIPVLRAVRRLRAAGIEATIRHAGTCQPRWQDRVQAFEPEVYAPMGQVPYEDALRVIRNADVGLVLSTGNAFESAVKLYDYIGMGRPLLIVGAPKGGALLQEAQAYGRYVHAALEEADIARCLRRLQDETDVSSAAAPPEAFGRRHQTKRLSDALDALVR